MPIGRVDVEAFWLRGATSKRLRLLVKAAKTVEHTLKSAIGVEK